MSVMTRSTDTTTATGHPKVPALDTGKIRAEETAAVTRTLSSIADPKERLQKAAAIIKAAEGEVAELDRRVKNLALSLALHEGARGVSNAIGMTRSGFYQMTEKVLGDPVTYEKVSPKSGKTLVKTKYVWPERPASWTPAVSERATAKKIRKHRDAITELPVAAAKLYAAQVRIDVANDERDAIVPVVVDSGVSAADVARIIERHPSRVSHLVKAAKK